MLEQLGNIKEQLVTPLRSAGVVLLFFTAAIIALCIIMALIRILIG